MAIDPHLTIPVIMALVALGGKYALIEGEVLGWLGKLINIGRAKKVNGKETKVYYIPKFIRKPLGACERCMVSVWGTGAIMVLGMMPVAYWVGTGIVLRYGWFAREVEVPSLLWILPAYWLAAVGLQEMFDHD